MLAYVAATFLSFPHPLPFLGGAVLDLGVVLSFLAPACLVLGLDGLRVRPAATSAFLWTVLAHGFVLHFIYVVTVVYGHAPAVIGVVAPFALATYAGAVAAPFGAVWVWFRDRGLANAWTAALLWTVLDHLRGVALTGWPWATMGYAQHLNPALLGLAQWTGVYGLSFAVVLGGVGIAEAVASLRAARRPSPHTVAAIGFVVFLHGFGWATRIQPGIDDDMLDQSVRIAVIQGNIDQGVKWNAAWIERTVATYEDLSRKAAAEGAELIVWPETALPGAVETDPSLMARIEALARETGATFVVGSVGVDLDAMGRVDRFYDSAFFVEPGQGFLPDRYDKTHLVPFGEYVPLRDLLGSLLGAVASGMARGDVTPGAAPRAVDLTLAATPDGGRRLLRAAVPICYELLFPHLVRRFVVDGGGILLSITNDAWYGRTGAPYHFLAITALRSAETGTYGMRAANTGVSAVIDSGGRVRERTPIFEEAYLVADVPVRRPMGASGGTFYVRHGDVFVILCWLGLSAAMLLGVWRRWSPARPSGGDGANGEEAR
jgi:apolipoprotein N-acyltransferase